MKTGTLALFALASSAKLASATFGWLDAKTFSCPSNTDNVCDDDQKGGFYWAGLNLGSFSGYKGFDFKGFECASSFDGNKKRDIISGRTFQDKCIKGVATPDKDSAPSISCGSSKTVKKFSVKEFAVSTEFDCTLEFHYEMPDKTTCKQKSFCRKSGTLVKNTQCGGAESVKIVYPPSGGKKSCNVGFHHVDFDCKPPQPPKPPVNTPTPSPPADTPTPTPESPSPTPDVPSPTPTYEVPTPSPESPTPTPEAPTPTPDCSNPENSKYCGTTPTPEAPTPTPDCSNPENSKDCGTTPVPESPTPTPEAPTPTPDCSNPENSKDCGTTPVPESPTPTPEAPTPTPDCSNPENSEACGTTTATPGSETPTYTPPFPVNNTTPAGPSETPPPATTTTTSLGPVDTPVATPPTETPTESTTSQEGVTTTPAPTKPTPEGPKPTAPCPDVLPQCLNTWLFSSGCKSNTDVDCMCENSEYVDNVYQCLAAYGASDDEVDSAQKYFQGICAPHIPNNPAIVTGKTPVTITAPPVVYTMPVTTVNIVRTLTVPCTATEGSSIGSVIPGSSTTTIISTALTVPQVVFETQTGTSTAVVSLVQGTAPATTGAYITTDILSQPTPVPTTFTSVPVTVPTGGLSPSPIEFEGTASKGRVAAGTLFAAALVAVLIM